MALNERQKLFVKEYLVDKNATQAAIRADYSEKTAHSQGPRLLEHVEIQEAIQSEIDKTHKKLDITTERIAEELGKMAFQDMAAEELNGLKHTDKNKALELLGKHKAMFTDKVEQTIDGDLNLNVEVTVVKSGY